MTETQRRGGWYCEAVNKAANSVLEEIREILAKIRYGNSYARLAIKLTAAAVPERSTYMGKFDGERVRAGDTRYSRTANSLLTVLSA